nr:hypothetical protein [uncultured Campylobacter sp.]
MQWTANLTTAAAINGKICPILRGSAFDYFGQKPTRRLLLLFKKVKFEAISSNLATFQTHTANLTDVVKNETKNVR